MARSTDIIRFNALRNSLYHTARRRTFELWNRIFNFAVVLLGAAAFAEMLPLTYRAYIGGLVATVGALQLVFDFAGAARTHQALQRDYLNVLAELEEHPFCDEDACRQWEGKLVRITAEEPPVLRALDSKAYNDALAASEWPNLEEERLYIPWNAQLFGWFWTFDGMQFDKMSERRAKRAAKLAAKQAKKLGSVPAE